MRTTYHNLKGINDDQLQREITRVKGARVAYERYLERLLKEQRIRLFENVEVDKHVAEAIEVVIHGDSDVHPL